MSRPRKMTLDFFPHDALARSDRKIQLLRKRHHNDGYATYFCLLEMVCQEDEAKLRLGESIIDEVIADECGLRDVQQLHSIIETCCRLDLLDIQLWQSERIVFSHEIHDRYVAKAEERKRDAERPRGYLQHRNFVFDRDGYQCVYCGTKDWLSVACCTSCNSSKGARTPQEWRKAQNEIL